MMPKPLAVKAISAYVLWLRYSDGVSGEVDLAEFAGRGVFKLWGDYSAFERVHIGEHGQIAWTDEIDMCSDAMYLRLTGKRPEDLFSNLSEMTVAA